MDAIHAHARFDDLDLDAESQWVGKGKQISVECCRQTKQAISIKLATTVGCVFTWPGLCKRLYGLTILFLSLYLYRPTVDWKSPCAVWSIGASEISHYYYYFVCYKQPFIRTNIYILPEVFVRLSKWSCSCQCKSVFIEQQKLSVLLLLGLTSWYFY